MSERTTLDQFSDEAETADAETVAESPERVTLFRYTADQYVNVAIAELARRVVAIRGPDSGIEIEPDRITVAPEADLEGVLADMRSVIRSAGENTHRRKALAHEINRTLEEMGFDDSDDRWIPSSPVSFPGKADTDVTIYADETVDADSLDQHGIPPEKVDRDVSTETSLYRLSQVYVGNTQQRAYTSQRDRFERYFEAFRSVLLDDAEADDSACMTCGSTAMPAYKDAEGEKVEYNQSFTLFASTSGQAKPLGARGRADKHKGRCVACLVAGFYYTLMSKIVRPTASTNNDARLFSPVGDFEELVSIRGNLAQLIADIDEPTDAGKARQQNFGTLYTDSYGMQTIDFYETVLRHLNVEYSGEMYNRERLHQPTGLASFVSEVGRTREIKSMDTVDPGSWVYDAVSQRSLDTGESYWPVDDVLAWFAHIEGDGTRGLVEEKDDLAFGILERDLAQIERAVFQFLKSIERNEASNVSYIPNKQYLDNYFSDIMNQSTTQIDSIDEEAIESIRRVASGLGQLFHSGDDIGVLIQLQNASTATEFLKAFEKASMQAQKKSVDEAPAPWEASRDDDVAEVLTLITDPDTFEPTKRMFVIHTSLAAQYQNVQNSDDTDAEPGGDEA